MLKAVFLLGFVAIATAIPSLKLPVFDETHVRQAYMEDAEEATPKILFVAPIPDTYPREFVEEIAPMNEGESHPAVDDDEAQQVTGRGKRSLQPGAPDYGVGGGAGGQDRNWGTDVRKDGPNTRVSIDGKHKGEGYDVEGRWSKVIRGPGKAKPDWHVGVRW